MSTLSPLEILTKIVAFIGLLGVLLVSADSAALLGSNGLFKSVILAKVAKETPYSLWMWLEPSGYVGRNLGLWLMLLMSAGYLLLLLRPTCFWSALIAYVPLLLFNNTFYMISYGQYQFMRLVLAYVLLANFAGSFFAKEQRGLAREVTCRFLKIHIALAYSFAGLNKAIGPDWWSGESMWRAMNFSYGVDTVLISGQWLGKYPAVLMYAGIGVVILETAYPLVFWKKTRMAIIVGAISMHIGIIVFQGLLLFGLTMIALNVFMLLSLREKDADQTGVKDVSPVSPAEVSV